MKVNKFYMLKQCETEFNKSQVVVISVLIGNCAVMEDQSKTNKTLAYFYVSPKQNNSH